MFSHSAAVLLYCQPPPLSCPCLAFHMFSHSAPLYCYTYCQPPCTIARSMLTFPMFSHSALLYYYTVNRNHCHVHAWPFPCFLTVRCCTVILPTANIAKSMLTFPMFSRSALLYYYTANRHHCPVHAWPFPCFLAVHCCTITLPTTNIAKYMLTFPMFSRSAAVITVESVRCMLLFQLAALHQVSPLLQHPAQNIYKLLQPQARFPSAILGWYSYTGFPSAFLGWYS